MIEKRTLARPYAKACFSLANEENLVEQWSRALKRLAVVTEDANAKHFIEDSTQLAATIEQFLGDLCCDFLSDTIRNFIRLLVQQKHLFLLTEISALYEAMRREQEGKSEVKFFSKIPLTTTQKNRFTNLLSDYFKRAVTVTWMVDENLFGGFLIKVGNETWDSSLRGQLTALKARVSD